MHHFDLGKYLRDTTPVGVEKARQYLAQESQYRLEGWHLDEALIDATARGEWVLVRTDFTRLISPLVYWFPDPHEPQGGLCRHRQALWRK